MFEWLKVAYPLGMATLSQCKIAVAKGKISSDQFVEITGTEYVA